MKPILGDTRELTSGVKVLETPLGLDHAVSAAILFFGKTWVSYRAPNWS